MKSTFISCVIILLLFISSNISGTNKSPISYKDKNPTSRIETFSFSSDKTVYEAKIYIPAAYYNNKDLPVIYLIDFTEQHFKVTTDEFETVIAGIKEQVIDALVVTLKKHHDFDAEPKNFQKHYNIFKNLSEYVLMNYSKNQSRTFIGKGSESGIVFMSMLLQESDNYAFNNFVATDPSSLYGNAIIDFLKKNKTLKKSGNLKLHFSFSTTNDFNMCSKIIASIEKANYPWLSYKTVYYKDNDYENTYKTSFVEGLKFIFTE